MDYPGYHTVGELAKKLNRHRQRISHTIDAIGLPVYRGHRNATMIRDEDVATLKAALERRPVTAIVDVAAGA